MNEMEIDFNSQVYTSVDELLDDAQRARRDHQYTNVKMNGIMIKVLRQQSQSETLFVEKINAQRRLDEHFERGGTQFSLSFSK